MANSTFKKLAAQCLNEALLANEIGRYAALESKLTDIWINIEEVGRKTPKYYYKSRLMTEYLMDIKQLTYDKILKDTISEDGIYAEMIKMERVD